MKDLIANFSDQILHAKSIGEKAHLTPHSGLLQNVVIVGLGGSGIGGTIASDLTRDRAICPITVIKGYTPPAFVNEHTLVIVSSYSGTTEESVNFLNESIKKGAKIVCITTGGDIAKIAKGNKIDCIEIPAGMPPRAGVGYSLIQILFILSHHKIIGEGFKNNIVSGSELLKKEEAKIQSDAQKIALALRDKIPVIYAGMGFEGVAIRFRQQLNENAKILAWTGILSEMNHNELVGWSKKNEDLAVVLFRNSFEYERISKRIEITKEIISKYTPHIAEIQAHGASFFEQTLYQIHMGDWISYFLAEMIGVDPMDVSVIDYLKESMAK